MAILAGVREASFGFVAETVELSAPMLSKHVALLEQAGYVHVGKGRAGRQSRTWLSLTDLGRERFDDHVRALLAITGEASSSR